MSWNATYPGSIGPMINPIIPAALAVKGDTGDFVTNAAKESAKRTASHLTAASSILSETAGKGKLKIVSAIYELETGAVSYLS